MVVAKNNIALISFLLASVGGFCDTVTFVAGDSIFSAHVTGNFIVFAAQLISGSTAGSWMKLLTFPVFVIAVITGGWLSESISGKYRILLVQSLLLLIGGGIATILPGLKILPGGDSMYFIVMITVFAMGLQTTFSRLFAKETFGPTTIMTGNVTQASLDLGNVLRKGLDGDPVSWLSLKKLFVIISGFLAGCLFGAWLAKIWGLPAIGFPGLILFLCYFASRYIPGEKEIA